MMTFNWYTLESYKAAGHFLDGVNIDYRTFWSPTDNVHQLLVDVLEVAQHSVVLNMYGLTDPELSAALGRALSDPKIYVQMSLDSTQAGGVSEKALLTTLQHDAPANSIAVGQSSRHAISHLKILIVDGIYTVSGSTNWSLGGEQKQDNQVDLSKDPVRAAEFRAALDRIHVDMLRQMITKIRPVVSAQP